MSVRKLFVFESKRRASSEPNPASLLTEHPLVTSSESVNGKVCFLRLRSKRGCHSIPTPYLVRNMGVFHVERTWEGELLGAEQGPEGASTSVTLVYPLRPPKGFQAREVLNSPSPYRPPKIPRASEALPNHMHTFTCPREPKASDIHLPMDQNIP